MSGLRKPARRLSNRLNKTYKRRLTVRLNTGQALPRKIRPPEGPDEDLIYANREEQDVLEARGGAGRRTQFGPKSFYMETDGGVKGGTTGIGTKTGGGSSPSKTGGQGTQNDAHEANNSTDSKSKSQGTDSKGTNNASREGGGNVNGTQSRDEGSRDSVGANKKSESDSLTDRAREGISTPNASGSPTNNPVSVNPFDNLRDAVTQRAAAVALNQPEDLTQAAYDRAQLGIDDLTRAAYDRAQASAAPPMQNMGFPARPAPGLTSPTTANRITQEAIRTDRAPTAPVTDIRSGSYLSDRQKALDDASTDDGMSQAVRDALTNPEKASYVTGADGTVPVEKNAELKVLKDVMDNAVGWQRNAYTETPEALGKLGKVLSGETIKGVGAGEVVNSLVNRARNPGLYNADDAYNPRQYESLKVTDPKIAARMAADVPGTVNFDRAVNIGTDALANPDTINPAARNATDFQAASLSKKNGFTGVDVGGNVFGNNYTKPTVTSSLGFGQEGSMGLPGAVAAKAATPAGPTPNDQMRPTPANPAISAALDAIPHLANLKMPDVIGALNVAASYVKQYTDAKTGFGSSVTGPMADHIVTKEAAKAVQTAEAAIKSWQSGTMTKVAATEKAQKAIEAVKTVKSVAEDFTPTEKAVPVSLTTPKNTLTPTQQAELDALPSEEWRKAQESVSPPVSGPPTRAVMPKSPSLVSQIVENIPVVKNVKRIATAADGLVKRLSGGTITASTDFGSGGKGNTGKSQSKDTETQAADTGQFTSEGYLSENYKGTGTAKKLSKKDMKKKLKSAFTAEGYIA